MRLFGWYIIWIAYLVLCNDTRAADNICKIALKKAMVTISAVVEDSVTVGIAGEEAGLLNFSWDKAATTLKMLKILPRPGFENNPNLYQKLYQQMLGKYPEATRVVFPNGQSKRVGQIK